MSIDADASTALPDPLLASTHGGEIVVRDKPGVAIPERAVFGVMLDVAGGDLGLQTQRGHVLMVAQARTLGGATIEHALAVLIRESGW